MFFGLQALLKEYKLSFDEQDLIQATKFAKLHEEGFKGILDDHNGIFPIQIDALLEGSIVKPGTPLVRIKSTNPKYSWIVQYVETILLRAIWYPTTVASLLYEVRNQFTYYHRKSSTSKLDNISFKLHDFGSRGVSSKESLKIYEIKL
jgi:nicotinamide phosphoribosyltransferase